MMLLLRMISIENAAQLECIRIMCHRIATRNTVQYKILEIKTPSAYSSH